MGNSILQPSAVRGPNLTQSLRLGQHAGEASDSRKTMPTRNSRPRTYAEWLAKRNARSLARLKGALPDIFPGPVLDHALARRHTPPTPRRAIESYWRSHPLRADRL